MIKGVTKNASSGKIWDVGKNLKILDNSIFNVDNKNVFTYWVWLGISIVIHKNRQI